MNCKWQSSYNETRLRDKETIGINSLNILEGFMEMSFFSDCPLLCTLVVSCNDIRWLPFSL